MIDLRAKDKDKICQLANIHFSTPIEILAYGSRVNGDNHESSDLDLVVKSKGKNNIDRNELIEFKEQLQKSTIPIIVQVMDWNNIPESFHANILEKNELLFTNTNTNINTNINTKLIK